MARYIIASRIRELARRHGRRVGRDYLQWLDQRVEIMVRAHAQQIRGRVTLRAEDAELLRRFRERA